MVVLLNAALFYAGWFACVMGAASGQPELGVAVAAVAIGVHLVLTPARTGAVSLILATGAIGFTIDTLLAVVGTFTFPGSGVMTWLSPPWLVAIWMMFATTLNGSLAWLAERPLLAAALGAVGGPASYGYGARLGAVEMPSSWSLVVLAVVWAVAMPGLFALRRRIVATPPPGAESVAG